MNKTREGIGKCQIILREIMKRKKWWMPYDVAFKYRVKTGKNMSESALTARFREMKDIICERRAIKGEIKYMYKMEKKGC
jgi:hypothetical protein